MFQRKLYNNYVFCIVYCLVVLCSACCVSQYCVVITFKCKKSFKGNYITTMYFVLCIVCCVSQYCVVPTIKCKKCFKGNYITTMYFVLCIVCCVVYFCCVLQYCVAPTIKCTFFQQNLFFFRTL